MRYASLRQGLVGCWCPSVSGPFGNRLPDLSGYGGHGTLTNFALSGTTSNWVVSNGKGALDFDGVDDYVLVTHKASLKSNSQAMSFWMNANGLPASGNDAIISIYTSNANSFEFIIPNLTSNLNFGSVTWQFVYAISSKRWYHVYGEVITNGTSGPGKLYVDGVLVDGVGTVSYAGAANTANIEIGRRGANYFPGKIDDIRIYNRALTESEIRLLASERGIGLKPERQRNRYSLPVTTPSRNRSSRFLGFPT